MSIRYSPVQQALHWITVVLMFTTLPIAWVASSMKDSDPRIDFYLDIHKAIGLTILTLTATRIVWRLFDRPPPHPRAMPAWNRWLSSAVGLGLLAVMIVMPVSGYLESTGHGYDIAPFGVIRFPRLFWQDKAVGDAGGAVHAFVQWIVYGLIGLHLAGVSYHLVVKRDGMLGRMLPPQALDPT